MISNFEKSFDNSNIIFILCIQQKNNICYKGLVKENVISQSFRENGNKF